MNNFVQVAKLETADTTLCSLCETVIMFHYVRVVYQLKLASISQPPTYCVCVCVCVCVCYSF